MGDPGQHGVGVEVRRGPEQPGNKGCALSATAQPTWPSERQGFPWVFSHKLPLLGVGPLGA